MTYVVLAPDHIRGIYSTWVACEAAVRGVPGAVYWRVGDRAMAEALLRGEHRRLDPGTYAFVDGNHEGGVGVVLVHRRQDGSTVVKEIATTVSKILPAFADELPRLRNVLAELAALLAAIRAVKSGNSLVVVHDYEGIGAWMIGAWRTRDQVIARVVETVRTEAATRNVELRFVHVRGHQSPMGGDEFALYNARADRLARDAITGAHHTGEYERVQGGR